jgi:hypothetical protein
MPDQKEIITQLESEYAQAINERSAWDTEWRKITDYLLPGRGIYHLYTKPQKRKMVSPKVINPIAREALGVLTSGLHGGLTSPSRPWFSTSFADRRIEKIQPIKKWREECLKIHYAAFTDSNFYPLIHSFYTEYGGFGTAAMYCGEDSTNPFRFELLTVGEYAYTMNAEGKLNKFFRTIYKTNAQLIEEFGEDRVSLAVKQNVKTSPGEYVTIQHVVYFEEYLDKPYTSVYWETGQNTLLRKAGFYEMPYFVARWDVIGSDIYGLGLGSMALPDIQRLQEMEKAFLMAAHKGVNPPLNAPSRKKGKIKTLPGGINYYDNPNEVVSSVYNVSIDYGGVIKATERVEARLRQIFFNDIFLTASRDPNASPLRTGEVNERREEKMLRLGPVSERVLHEFFSPLIERTFNIMARKGMLPALDPSYAEQMGRYEVKFVSPLAQAQKAMAAQPINIFLQAVTTAAQFQPTVVDKVDGDNLIDEYADITGVPTAILREQAKVDGIRQARAEQQAAEKQAAVEAVQTRQSLENQETQSNIAKNYSETGLTMAESTPQMM